VPAGGAGASPVELISPVIKVGGAQVPEEAALVQLDIDLGLNLVGRATLRYLERSFDVMVLPKFSLGTEVTIGTLADGTAEKNLFKGLVTGVSLEQDSNSGTVLTVTVDDGAHKLGQHTQNTAFLNSTYSDVITKMVAGTGLQSDIDATTQAHPYLLQTGTNLAYLDWVVGRCGMVWWVDYGKLMVKKISAPPSAVAAEVSLTHDLIRLSTRASGLHTGKVTVTGWDDAQQAAVANVADKKATPESTLVEKFPGRVSPTGVGTKVSGASPLTADEAKLVSETMLAESTSAAVTTRGTCYANGAIKPFTKIKVTNAGPASGTYLVTRVQHVFAADGFVTHFTAGPIRPEGLVDLLAAPVQSSGATISDLMVGVVTNINDNEGKIGRVKVKFPTIGSDIESEWARVVTLGGGASRGVVFQPEVNDEVLVGFEQGDTRRPVVLGGLFSKKNALPTTDNVDPGGKVTYRRINSRTGHLIELADGTSPDKKHILLKTSNGHLIRLGEDKLELTVADKPVTITNGKATIEFTASGDINIEGMNINIKAKTGIKIEGAQIETKASGTAKIESPILDVKASGTATVDGGGMLTLKGGMVAIN
jgi:uncharacterized protein involved in type VI secretion and phage assembly